MKEDDFMGLELGQYLRGVRKEKKMSVKELSLQSKVSKSYIDYIECGSREPMPEMLAKIAVVLNIPLSVLIDIQKKEQLAEAINKLRVERAETTEKELEAIARTVDGKLSVSDQALIAVQEAFRDSDNALFVSKYIVNPDLRAIVQAGSRLLDEDLGRLKKVIESLHPEAFNN